jgi:hypothetical protein
VGRQAEATLAIARQEPLAEQPLQHDRALVMRQVPEPPDLLEAQLHARHLDELVPDPLLDIAPARVTAARPATSHGELRHRILHRDEAGRPRALQQRRQLGRSGDPHMTAHACCRTQSGRVRTFPCARGKNPGAAGRIPDRIDQGVVVRPNLSMR